MLVLLNKMLLLLLLMSLGYVGARKKLLTPEFTKGASWLTMNVFLTATILNAAFAGATELGLAEIGRVLLFFTLSFGFCYALSFALTRLLRIDRERAPVFELLVSVVNNMYVGLPVVQLLYGPGRPAVYMAISCLPFNFLLFSYGVWRLRGGGKGAVRWRDMLSVPMISTLVTLVLILLRPPVPGVIKDMASTISGATVPLSMIVIGSSLGRVSLLDAFREKSLYLASFLRLIAAPVLVWLLLGSLCGEKLLADTMVITAACPSGVLVSILSIQYGQDVEYASKGVLMSTALSMLTIPALVALLL